MNILNLLNIIFDISKNSCVISHIKLIKLVINDLLFL